MLRRNVRSLDSLPRGGGADDNAAAAAAAAAERGGWAAERGSGRRPRDGDEERRRFLLEEHKRLTAADAVLRRPDAQVECLCALLVAPAPPIVLSLLLGK